MLQGIFLIGYFLVAILIGRWIVKKWFSVLPFFGLRMITAIVFGVIFFVTLTYVLSCLLVFTRDPIFYSMLLVFFCGLSFIFIKRKDLLVFGIKQWRNGIPDSTIFIVAFLFSTWLMFKSFRAVSGALMVGSNEVFDFGHLLSIIRSMSEGSNIPFMSPFDFGVPHVYHFFFYFLVAMVEHMGVPIVMALNIPSIVSFTLFLVSLYYLPQVIFGKNKVLGWLCVILTITHSTLTFFYYILEKGFNSASFLGIWRMQKYFFAGPYDGSVISIFQTLNVFVNQRHLAISLTVVVLCIMILFLQLQKKFTSTSAIILGIVVACFPLWNIVLPFGLFACINCMLLFSKKIREAIIFSMVSTLGVVWFIPLYPFVQSMRGVSEMQVASVTPQPHSLGMILEYYCKNFGLLIPMSVFGLFLLKKKEWMGMMPFFLCFLFSLGLTLTITKEGDQKFLNVWVIGANILSSYTLVWLWKKGIAVKLLAIILFVVITISGIMDLMVIKNDFAYQIMTKENTSLARWIEKTPAHTVILSPPDIFDPVTLSGRYNYFGFFHSFAKPKRDMIVKRVYEAKTESDVALSKTLGISYLVVPKWEKKDFSYVIDKEFLKSSLPASYEDDFYIVFSLH